MVLEAKIPADLPRLTRGPPVEILPVCIRIHWQLAMYQVWHTTEEAHAQRLVVLSTRYQYRLTAVSKGWSLWR